MAYDVPYIPYAIQFYSGDHSDHSPFDRPNPTGLIANNYVVSSTADNLLYPGGLLKYLNKRMGEINTFGVTRVVLDCPGGRATGGSPVQDCYSLMPDWYYEILTGYCQQLRAVGCTIELYSGLFRHIRRLAFPTPWDNKRHVPLTTVAADVQMVNKEIGTLIQDWGISRFGIDASAPAVVQNVTYSNSTDGSNREQTYIWQDWFRRNYGVDLDFEGIPGQLADPLTEVDFGFPPFPGMPNMKKHGGTTPVVPDPALVAHPRMGGWTIWDSMMGIDEADWNEDGIGTTFPANKFKIFAYASSDDFTPENVELFENQRGWMVFPYNSIGLQVCEDARTA